MVANPIESAQGPLYGLVPLNHLVPSIEEPSGPKPNLEPSRPKNQLIRFQLVKSYDLEQLVVLILLHRPPPLRHHLPQLHLLQPHQLQFHQGQAPLLWDLVWRIYIYKLVSDLYSFLHQLSKY